MPSFEPKLEILTESQRALWPELDDVPSDFVLYGGTALALQLGHRVSEDFDFFSSQGFDPERLRSRLPFLRDLDKSDPDVWVHRKRDNLEAYVERRGATVKVAFFGGLENLKRVQDPRYATGSRVQVASLVDLAGMKMRVIQMRGSWKDYVDKRHVATIEMDRDSAEIVSPERARLAPLLPLRGKHEMIDDQLRAAVEEIGKRKGPRRPSNL